MNLLDLLIVGTFLLLLLYSFCRGFIREIFSLSSLILGLWLAIKFYFPIGNKLAFWATNPALKNFIGFIFIFLGIRFSGWLLENFIQKLLNLGKIKIWDRILGMLLGFTKSIIIVIFFITILLYFLPGLHPLLRQSKLSPYVIEMAKKFPLSFFPEGIKDKVEKKRKKLISRWDDKVMGKKEQGDFSRFF
ncbi:MAG: CvpA family protein [Desulfobacterota bacterium]|nr:CvpA family protein [Thermodesulfobacteriota bacterium]